MTTTQSNESQARLSLATRIGRGHLSPEERWIVAGLVAALGLRAEDGLRAGPPADCWRHIVQEYRRLVPEGGGE